MKNNQVVHLVHHVEDAENGRQRTIVIQADLHGLTLQFENGQNIIVDIVENAASVSFAENREDIADHRFSFEI